jgi:hypothetical protein
MFTKIISLAMSLASRGLHDSKTDIVTKKLRYISCFGYEDISPCPKLKKSSKSNYHYCGGCGCGDHSHTLLVRGSGEYSKLDYPILNCPLKMPGFSNYDLNSVENKERKEKIENLDPEKLNFIQITVNVDPEKEKIIEKLNKLNQNS